MLLIYLRTFIRQDIHPKQPEILFDFHRSSKLKNIFSLTYRFYQLQLHVSILFLSIRDFLKLRQIQQDIWLIIFKLESHFSITNYLPTSYVQRFKLKNKHYQTYEFLNKFVFSSVPTRRTVYCCIKYSELAYIYIVLCYYESPTG